MNSPENLPWKPWSISTAAEKLASHENWFFAGGQSLRLMLPEYRQHGDLDIGVLDIHLNNLLKLIQSLDLQVFYCLDQQLWPLPSPQALSELPAKVHNFWVADSTAFRFEVLAYGTRGDTVVFRRNPNISWPITDFVIESEGHRWLNPIVTYTFKITNADFRYKDQQDVDQLTHGLRVVLQDNAQ